MASVPEREEIDDEHKWSVDEVYSHRDEWEAEKEEVEEMLDRLEGYEDSVTESPEDLLATLQLYEKVMRKVNRLYRYASMKKDEDTRVQENQALHSRARSLSSKASGVASFIEPEIQQAGRERIEELVEQEPGLEKYRHHLDDVLRLADHTRSGEVEELLADLGEVIGSPGDIYSSFTNADLEFPEVEKPSGEKIEITQSNFTKLLKHGDREFREEVYEKLYDTLSGYRNTLGTTLESSVKADVKLARARDYETAREAALDQDNVPVEVYDRLVETVTGNLKPLHRHLELKQRHLGLEQIEMHDVYMPLVEDEPEMSYEDAKEHVLEALEPMGEEYVEIARNGLEEEGWVDVYENRGKRSGAYSGGAYDTKPFILMNYQEDISSMYTLAHELGHSMHSYFTRREQPYIYSAYPIFLAEVASTVNEALLTRHLLENAGGEIQKAALSHSLENFRGTLFRQTMFAEFEHRIHGAVEEGEALTPGRLDEAYTGLKKEFYRPVELDDRIEKEWMRIPHFYYNFYVFQYSTGMSAALALSEQIIEEGPESYQEFLERGSREYPLETLREAGVDMSSSKPFKTAIEAYSERLDRMEELL
ncbi:MAG: oligoendopeptidase F [Candidatus Nanohaloarchaea archaeon]